MAEYPPAHVGYVGFVCRKLTNAGEKNSKLESITRVQALTPLFTPLPTSLPTSLPYQPRVSTREREKEREKERTLFLAVMGFWRSTSTSFEAIRADLETDDFPADTCLIVPVASRLVGLPKHWLDHFAAEHCILTFCGSPPLYRNPCQRAD